MEGGMGDEVAPLDVAEGAHLRGKEGEYSLKPPESSNKLESHEIVMRDEVVCHESSFNMIADILEGKNVNRGTSSMDASEQQYGSPRSMDEAGNMVEELMVRNYDSSKLAIVSASNNRGSMQTKQNQWQHLYQLGGGSASGSSHGNVMNREHGRAISWDDIRRVSSPELLGHKSSSDDGNEVAEQLNDVECRRVSGNMISHGGIRTKILSKSGFSEFFVKSTLKGKGIIFKGPPHDVQRVESRDENNVKTSAQGVESRDGNTVKTSAQTLIASNALSGVKSTTPSGVGIAVPRPGSSDNDGMSLREWLNSWGHKVKKVECLHIFKQIVDLVDYSHSQGIALHDLQPSHFYLLRSNQVKYLGSAVQRDDMVASATHQDIPYPDNHVKRRRMLEQGYFPSVGPYTKKQKFGENMNYMSRWPQFSAKYNFRRETSSDADISAGRAENYVNEHPEHNLKTQYGIQDKSMTRQLSSISQQQSTSVSDQFEDNWYASPEELNEGTCTVSSNIYSLGVLLFELLGCFDSERARAAAMLDLRHRILPPQILSENPKEAGFCLWLLHPEPSSRPTTKEIQQSEVINGLQEVSANELSSSIDHDDTESELLSFFLSSVNEHKQKQASKLEEYIRCIDSDIEEVEKRHCARKSLVNTALNSCFLDAKENAFQRNEPSTSAPCQLSPSNMNEMRLVNNLAKIESAYLSMRTNIQLAQADATTRQDKDLLRSSENLYVLPEGREQNSTDSLGAFFDGLCKYARYSKFEVRGLLRTADFNNSSNVICSLSFDRDLDYFAAAGVSKKIKIFEFNALLDDSIDIHYPVIEMSNKSRLSCICWNNYIKNYLASTGYDGVVKLWDTNTGQGVFQYSEHEKRAWSVDFSQVYPTKLASGSDDCTVKLWNINEKSSLGTIRNIANVCCVQFSSHSSHLLAFGSADYRTYCYDLRNVRSPWCVLAGHGKAVSHVKFLDHETVVTASTDNSLKLWDLNKTSNSGLSTAACSLTLEGHTNEKNFVGLSVADGYIACGSETNEVYAYYRSLPMPNTSHKFGSIDPISGRETEDDNGQFVSSVCWRGNSDMIIAANSTGSMKVLQMV